MQARHFLCRIGQSSHYENHVEHLYTCALYIPLYWLGSNYVNMTLGDVGNFSRVWQY